MADSLSKSCQMAVAFWRMNQSWLIRFLCKNQVSISGPPCLWWRTSPRVPNQLFRLLPGERKMMRYQFDWLGAWISRRTRKGSYLRRLPTDLISHCLDLVRSIVIPAIYLGLLLWLIDSWLITMPLNLFHILCVIVLSNLSLKIGRWCRGEPSHSDGYWAQQSIGKKIARYIWQICSCERVGPLKAPQARRERRTLRKRVDDE